MKVGTLKLTLILELALGCHTLVTCTNTYGTGSHWVEALGIPGMEELTISGWNRLLALQTKVCKRRLIMEQRCYWMLDKRLNLRLLQWHILLNNPCLISIKKEF